MTPDEAPSKTPVAVLVSGSGSNLQALLDAAADPAYPARIAVVLSNRPRAYALERAHRAGVPTEVLPHRGYARREDYDAALLERLAPHAPRWVCLAGFMRLLTPVFLDAFPWRILNVHPALLPAFPGIHGPRQALAAGVRIAGCTVHLVDPGTDTGPILAQAAVPVREGDDEAALAARILRTEHQLYPRVLRWAVEGRIHVEAPRAEIDLPTGEERFLLAGERSS